MIEVDALRKEYGSLVAVDGVGFRAQPGAISAALPHVVAMTLGTLVLRNVSARVFRFD